MAKPNMGGQFDGGAPSTDLPVNFLKQAKIAVAEEMRNTSTASSNFYRIQLRRIKEEGIKWVRLETTNLEVVKYACEMNLNVIAIIKSQDALLDFGGIDMNSCWPLDWRGIWRAYIEKKVEALCPLGVKVWQVDNELNHPGLNLLPSQNISLAQEIVKIGAKAILSMDPNAITSVNLNYSPPFIEAKDFIEAFRRLRDVEGVPLHILGMDYYKGGWNGLCPGSPLEYSKDIAGHHELWSGDIMIMETGFCTCPDSDFTQKLQTDFMKSVFLGLDALIRKASWFKGLMWYEYNSGHFIFPCEDYFGLHHRNGMESDRKPAWGEFVNFVEKYARFDKMLGIQYHQYR